MNENLVIVFVKNITLGKVKTRLAKTIGNQAAFEVYTQLVGVTEEATTKLKADKHIYFSNSIVEHQWKSETKFVQEGLGLGERMKNAFKKGFKDGYKKIVLIGSDLPDITAKDIHQGLDSLKKNDIVFGPAEDGGYYLIGLSKMNEAVFDNKPWSAPNLLKETLLELKTTSHTVSLLRILNDIDTFEDLKISEFYKSNIALQKRIRELNATIKSNN